MLPARNPLETDCEAEVHENLRGLNALFIFCIYFDRDFFEPSFPKEVEHVA